MEDRVKAIKQLAEIPLVDDAEIHRVEIVMLKFREAPEVINEAVSRVIQNTTWPFKLNIFDNRLNSANTSKIWNKLLAEATSNWVLFIDTDAFVPADITPCWLTRLMENSNEAVVVPMGDNVGGTNKATGPATFPAYGEANGIWSGFCFLLNREKVYEKFGVKPFDEDFYFYGQDSEFAYRTLKKHCAIFRHDVFVQHMGSYSGKKAETEGSFDREADKMYAGALYRLKTSGRL